MFSLSKFNQHNFHDGIITESQNYSDCSILRGEFPEDDTEINGYKYFFFHFDAATPKLPHMGDCTDILSFDICERKDGKNGYSVRICADNHGYGFILAEFTCENIIFYGQKCEGMSYCNMYGTAEYNAYVESRKYVLNETYFKGKEQYALPEGFIVEIENYEDIRETGVYFVNWASMQKCTLMRDGQPVYEYLCNYHHAPFCEFIYHSNGHRYYPFHIELYGISYLDVDTLDVYHYIPEGYPHEDGDNDIPLGESFIITDIHYDRKSGLIAYGGCFWAGPANVMVGDFSCPTGCGYPMENMQSLIDPHYDQYEELDFAGWGEGELLLKCGGISASVATEEIKKRLTAENLYHG